MRSIGRSMFLSLAGLALVALPGCFLDRSTRGYHFTATPQAICAGESSTLDWGSYDDGSCGTECTDTDTLSPGPGPSVDPATETFEVTPAATTEYSVRFGTCESGTCLPLLETTTVRVVEVEDRLVWDLDGWCGPRWRSLDMERALSRCMRLDLVCLEDAGGLPPPIQVTGNRPDGERETTPLNPGDCTDVFNRATDWTLGVSAPFLLDPTTYGCEPLEGGTPPEVPTIRLRLQVSCADAASCIDP